MISCASHWGENRTIKSITNARIHACKDLEKWYSGNNRPKLMQENVSDPSAAYIYVFKYNGKLKRVSIELKSLIFYGKFSTRGYSCLYNITIAHIHTYIHTCISCSASKSISSPSSVTNEDFYQHNTSIRFHRRVSF